MVDSIVQHNKSKSLPVDALSVTLIDTQTNEKAEYQGDLLRYPASVVKMFWLVAIQYGSLKNTMKTKEINKGCSLSGADSVASPFGDREHH